jgi:hypothetical protein
MSIEKDVLPRMSEECANVLESQPLRAPFLISRQGHGHCWMFYMRKNARRL